MSSKEEALSFINKHGFVTLFPIRGKDFPSLYQAIIGTREEKFQKAFKWADELSINEKSILYGKLVDGQITLISMEMLPYFYKAYHNRKLTDTANRVLTIIKQNGPRQSAHSDTS